MLKYLRILCAALMFAAVTLFFFDWTSVQMGTARDEAALISSSAPVSAAVSPSDSASPAPAESAEKTAPDLNTEKTPESAGDKADAAENTAEAVTLPASAKKMSVSEGSFPEKIQFMPAVMHHAHWVILTLVILTLCFGRLYCSVICPLGIMQDGIAWLSQKIHRGKPYVYKKPLPILRWFVLLLAVGGFLAGYGVLLNLVEPYSIFGRIANAIFRPIYVVFNNACLVSDSAEGSQSYSMITMSNVLLSLGAFVTAFASFFIVGILAWRGGRTYCNTVCPVGTFLGFLSRFSVFKVRIDAEKCKSCGMCAKKCKSSCMNTKGKCVDNSRCVTCFNCLGSCKFDALSYSAGNPFAARTPAQLEALKKAAEKEAKTEAAPNSAQVSAPNSTQNSAQASAQNSARREFLITAASMAASVPVVAGVSAAVSSTVMVKPRPDKEYKTGQHAWVRENPVAPPGAGSYEHLLHHCTGCHLCVAKCPQHVLKPSFMEYGLRGMFVPVMDYRNSFCNYDCTVCSEVCPNGAISIQNMIAHRGEALPETKPELAERMREEKNYVQMGRVVFKQENCVVAVDGTFCGACDEHCPTKAVSMVPYGDPEKGLTIPHIDDTICIGCGGCESICPARPYKAIYVEGCTKQERRAEFKEAEVISEKDVQEKVGNVDDWLY